MTTVTRERQTGYSTFEARTLDEAKRRRKASKLISVLRHYLGQDSFEGRRVLDVGCSAGFICDALADTGAEVIGIDIDVPGLRRAQARFGHRVRFLCGDGSTLPMPDRSVDIVVLNHIYEHVVDPDAVLAEIRRVLADDGVAYLGLGNKLWVMEPHHKLPGLSLLPPALADRYVRLAGKGDHYYERYRTRQALRRMMGGLHVWDYTLPVIAEPDRFHATGDLPGVLTRLPAPVLRSTLQVVPTYIWVAARTPVPPAGPTLPVPPAYLAPVVIPARREPPE